MCSKTVHHIRIFGILAAIGLTSLVLGGCFLLGPQVVIPTLAPNASPVVGVVKEATPEPTITTTNESGGDSPTPEASGTTQKTATKSPTHTITPKPSLATPSLTPKPNTATPTSQPPCPQQIDDRLLAVYNAAGGRARLGCAIAGAIIEPWGYQEYERGWMFWRGPKAVIYVGKPDANYAIYPDEWNSSLPERACDISAPSGLLQPKRGFGLVWCTGDQIRAVLGFAKGEEFPAQTVVQEFDNGVAAAQAGGSTRIFFSDYSWKDLGVLP